MSSPATAKAVLGRAEALDAAAEFVDTKVHPLVPPTRPNGYAVDGWKVLPANERLQLILKVADYLVGDQPQPEDLPF